MRAAPYDQIRWAPVTRSTWAKLRNSGARIAETEFSDAFRNPRLSPGWVLLPGAAIAFALAFAFF